MSIVEEILHPAYTPYGDGIPANDEARARQISERNERNILRWHQHPDVFGPHAGELICKTTFRKQWENIK